MANAPGSYYDHEDYRSDNPPKAQGGGGGESAYNSNIVTLEGGTSSSNGVVPYIEVIYTSPSTTGGESVTTKTIVTGSGTDTLTLNTDTVGIQTVRCKVSHPTACNAPANDESIVGSTSNSAIYTKTARFESISAVNEQKQILKYELVQDDDSSHFVDSGDLNLYLQNINLASDPGGREYRAICVYSPEGNVDVEVTMAGSAGVSPFIYMAGEGGKCTFTYTLKENTEYMFLLGGSYGVTSSIGRGGAGAYFYEKGKLLVACGGGGGAGGDNAGTNRPDGGDGGGPGFVGANGQGGIGHRGQGGNDHFDDTSGQLPNGREGGRVELCTTGNYWSNAGYSPCDDVGQQQFRTYQGTIVQGSATLQRGYKASGSDAGSTYGYRHNGGNSSSTWGSMYVGGGGAGARGGNAAKTHQGGGGGGSGYSDGSVTIISSQQGGNGSLSSYAIIKLS
tara:strand:+ start:1172 stop:2518 length:1347 start_codon:yes stop_codon:yes gene_type:complete